MDYFDLHVRPSTSLCSYHVVLIDKFPFVIISFPPYVNVCVLIPDRSGYGAKNFPSKYFKMSF